MSSMKKHTYRFNPHTLSYEKVKVSILDRVKNISFSVLFGFILGVLFIVLGGSIFDSPKEKALRREISQYRSEVKALNQRVDRASRVLHNLEQRDDNVYRLIFGAKPINSDIRHGSVGGPDRYHRLHGYDSEKALVEANQKVDNLTKRLYVESRSIDEVYEMARNKQQRMASIPAIMPINKRNCKIVSGFGYRFHPILHYRRMHTGIDMTAQKGTPIYATGDGVVEVAGGSQDKYSGYGVVCVINHGFGFKTLYGHLSSVDVRVGQRVKRGEQLGRVGSSGLSSGTHLHYEVLQNGNHVNPVYFFFEDLTPAEYEEVIDLANQENQCLS